MRRLVSECWWTRIGTTARQLAYQELVHYQRQSEHQRTDDIQDDERSTAVFAHDIGELPDTAQPYGTACGGQQDSNF